jgi:hypothetical protein
MQDCQFPEVERRRFERLKVESKIQFRVLGPSGEGELAEAVYKNICADGILLETRTRLHESDELELHINIPSQTDTGEVFSSPLQVKGRVTRVEELPQTNVYRVGIKLHQSAH